MVKKHWSLFTCQLMKSVLALLAQECSLGGTDCLGLEVKI